MGLDRKSLRLAMVADVCQRLADGIRLGVCYECHAAMVTQIISCDMWDDRHDPEVVYRDAMTCLVNTEAEYLAARAQLDAAVASLPA